MTCEGMKLVHCMMFERYDRIAVGHKIAVTCVFPWRYKIIAAYPWMRYGRKISQNNAKELMS